MTDEYPRLVYRPGTEHRIWNQFDCDVLQVADQAEHQAALKDGWHDDPSGDHGEAETVEHPPKPEPEPTPPPAPPPAPEPLHTATTTAPATAARKRAPRKRRRLRNQLVKAAPNETKNAAF